MSHVTDGPMTSAGPGPSPTATPPPSKQPRAGAGQLLGPVLRWEALGALGATVLLVAITAVLHPEFLTVTQLLDVAQSAVYVGLLAGGMAFLLAMRELDLSVGSTFALTLTGAALLMQDGMNPWLAAVIGVAGGAFLGLNNAIIVHVVSIPTIVATLATLSLYRGLALALSGGQQIAGLPFESSFFTVLGGRTLGIPTAVWVVVVITGALTVLLRFTAFGYRVRSIGSNPDAAVFAGISIAKTRTQVLVLVGALAGLAGVLGLAFFSSGDPNVGVGLELQAIAAAIIGGTALRGGKATIVGAVIGGFLLSVVTSALAYFDIPANWNAFATGTVILAAVSVDGILRRRRTRRAR
jgi:ribose transport system permease protein